MHPSSLKTLSAPEACCGAEEGEAPLLATTSPLEDELATPLELPRPVVRVLTRVGAAVAEDDRNGVDVASNEDDCNGVDVAPNENDVANDAEACMALAVAVGSGKPGLGEVAAFRRAPIPHGICAPSGCVVLGAGTV